MQLRNATVDSIVVDEIPAQRELKAARFMLQLLRLHSPRAAIVAALDRRGAARVLRDEDAMVLLRMCQHRGVDQAWRAAVRAGFFLHMDLPLLPGFAFDINAMSDYDCRTRFRFDHAGIKALVVCMRMPDVLIVPYHGDRFSALEGVCLVLDRMTYPRQWEDLSKRYDRHVSALSRIFLYMLHRILSACKEKILFSQTTTPARLARYARAFWDRGVPRDLRVWSIIDVKKVATCRPTNNQRAQYSGHKKYHCFKYQTLQTPDGLIAHCFRCADGRRGDGYILRESALLPFLTSKPEITDPIYVVFGDSAYPNNNVMISMFRGRNLPVWSQVFNRTMASVRIAVEWGYAQVCNKIAYVDWKRQLKIELLPVEAIWHVGVFLTNCHTCYWGSNLISDYFECSPPTLDEYLEDFNFN